MSEQADEKISTSGRKRSSRAGEVDAEVTEVKDSRGRSTVQVTLRIGDALGIGDVPAGASTGEDEARTVECAQAIENIKKVILPLLKQSDLDLRRHESIVQLDEMMTEAAGENFETLGANAVLPVSRALWQLAAGLRRLPLAGYIRKYESEVCESGRRCHLYMNIFNGGLHALQKGETLGNDRMDIQEIMVVPVGVSNYREALMVGERIDSVLKDLLSERYGADKVTRADESGFSVQGLGNSSEAIALVFEAIERAGYVPGQDVKVALDLAASSFYNKTSGSYVFLGREFSRDDMIAYLIEVADFYKDKILSVEDGLDENDWEGWSKLSEEMEKRGVLTIGDDLFVTQMPRLRRGVNNKSAHAVLIKPNQNGSMSGTLSVMRYARRNGIRCVVSHRSGETLDTSIADLAVATGALGIKTGDPQPESDFPDPKTWVRRAKYLRMIDLEESGRRY